MPTTDAPLSPEAANAIYSVLVQHAGGAETDRDAFVYHQTHEFVSEFRFCGSLGFGGKFWRNTGFLPDDTWGERWYVNTYSETLTADRRAAIDATNEALEQLRTAHAETTAL